MSAETLRRVKRTLLQSLAGGAFTSVAVAALGGGRKEVLVAGCTAVGTVIAAYFQNMLEDSQKITDRRAA